MARTFLTPDGSPVGLDQPRWRSPDGGLLTLSRPEPGAGLDPDVLARRPPSLWRYRESFPLDPTWTDWMRITMGEGMTPLVPVDADRPGVLAKLDYALPTLSFKDRGAVVLVARAASLGATSMVADSSGNAGVAIAAYAARAGIACEVFVPAATKAAKQGALARHGAVVHAVGETREETAAAALAHVEETAAFYASHVFEPTFWEGTKTFAFEVWEQLGRAPDVVVLPVGNGTLVLGCALGFAELVAAGHIEQLPEIVAVQAAACAPLADGVASVVGRPTAADGIAIAAPARAAEVNAAVAASGGRYATVDEAEIAAARADLARRGFDVEPTAACTWAALRRGIVDDDALVVTTLCGAGLTSP